MKSNQTWSITQTNRSLSSITEEAFQDFIQKNRTGLRNQMSVKQQYWGKLLGGQS